METQARVLGGNRCIASLNGMLRKKGTSRESKIKKYKTIVRLAVLYACLKNICRTDEGTDMGEKKKPRAE